MQVLSINCGSSSAKVAVHDVRATTLAIAAENGRMTDLDAMIERIARGCAIDAVAHRLVHGGPHLFEPVRVDADVLRTLLVAVPFAPLHLPPALDAIARAQHRWPSLPHVACFDTGFHRTLPDVARRLPFPAAIDAQGVRRYGFHGLSYEYVVRALGPKARGRMVIAHLGNGASLAAVNDGACVDTTMGFTPSGGVIMGTRAGDVDPGALLYLLRAGYDATRLESLVDHESGLRGISGLTSDMRELLARRAHDATADLAIRMFVVSIAKAVGALAVALGGLERLVFTGGIGENAEEVRRAILERLTVLGSFESVVVATDENRMMAEHAARLVHALSACP